MHSVVITPTLPPTPGRDVNGVYKRLSMFMHAIATISDTIDVVHIVPSSFIERSGGGEGLQADQRRYWGADVNLHLVPRSHRRETFVNHYVQGVWDAGKQPELAPFCGTAQSHAIGGFIARADLVFVHCMAAMAAVLRSPFRHPCMFFDLGDLEHKVKQRSAFLPPFRYGKLLYRLQVSALLRAEIAGSRVSQATFVCSPGDRDTMTREGASRVCCIPNAITVPSEAVVSTQCHDETLLFLGSLQYQPNIDAVRRLLDRIWPKIRMCKPDARLIIAGSPSERLPQPPPDGVTYSGFVSSLDDLYRDTRVVCCPIDTGGGTRLKVIEAAAYGKPIVSTTIGAEGLCLEDGVDIMIRDSDEEFAAACIALLDDVNLCERIGRAARATSMAHYDLPSVQTAITGIFSRESAEQGHRQPSMRMAAVKTPLSGEGQG